MKLLDMVENELREKQGRENMITKEKYEIIKSKLELFKYNAMNYIDFEDIMAYTLLCENEELILLHGYSKEHQLDQYYWACNQVDYLIEEVVQAKTKGLLTFVPKEWVEPLKEVGFQIFAVWNEYFIETLQEEDEPFEIERVPSHEAENVSAITLACRGQSRGFTGQSTQWVGQWIEGRGPAVSDSTKNSAIFAKKIEDEIVGIICVATYGHESEKGPILWIRELAVHPEYQKKGIARDLIKKAYVYGRALGAKRAFLMADECNEHAIHLYERMGFVCREDESEINMIH